MKMKMPFGKYKNWDLSELPDNYLEWLRFEIDLREPLLSAVRREMLERDGCTSDCRDHTPSNLDAGQIQRIYRNMAFKWHPDRGGTTSAMQAINEFYDELKQL